MLAIKLQRVGKKHQPSFRIVIAEKRSKLIAPPVEDIGSYNPFTKAVRAEKERVAYWIKSGAKPTPTVWNLLLKAGAITGAKVAIKIHPRTNTEEKSPTPSSTGNAATNPQSSIHEIIGVGVKKPVAKAEAPVEAAIAAPEANVTPPPAAESVPEATEPAVEPSV